MVWAEILHGDVGGGKQHLVNAVYHTPLLTTAPGALYTYVPLNIASRPAKNTMASTSDRWSLLERRYCMLWVAGNIHLVNAAYHPISHHDICSMIYVPLNIVSRPARKTMASTSDRWSLFERMYCIMLCVAGSSTWSMLCITPFLTTISAPTIPTPFTETDYG